MALHPPIPLALRVPNAPSAFVGREEALAAFVLAARRGPIVVVSGPQGIGKTAFLLQALHRSFARRLEGVRYVRLLDGPPAQAVLPALMAGRALRGEDWAGLLADPDVAPAAALDLAEAQEAWLVIDADNATDAEALAGWIHGVARFARRSRWLVTTRLALEEDEYLRGQLVALGGLPEADLRALAAKVAPGIDAETVGWALRLAGGSPGWLRRALVEGGVGDPAWQQASLHQRLLPELSVADHDALLRRAVAEVPLPPSAVPALSAEARARLNAVGWLEGGWVSAVPRAQLAAATPGDLWRRACAQTAAALADLPAPAALWALEALRLWLAAQDTVGAAEWLDIMGESLVAGGYAMRLWALLEPRLAPPLERWRLRAAVEAGAAASRTLAAPHDPDAATRFEWARALGMRGDLVAAEAEALRAGSETTDARLARAALLFGARCAMNGGRIEAALQRLEVGLADGTADLAASALLTTCRVVLGRPGALAEARALAAQASARDDGDAVRARLPIAVLFYRSGRLRESEAVFNLLLRDEAVAPLALRRPEIGMVHFAVRLARGRLDEAGRELERLAPLLAADSLWGLPLAQGDIALRLARGTLAGLEVDLPQLIEVASRKNRPDLLYFGISLLEDHARLLAVDGVPVAVGPPASPYYEVLVGLHRNRRLARAGQPTRQLAALDHADCVLLAHMVAADTALAAGQSRAALIAAGEALAVAQDHGFRIHEAEILEQLADACLIAGAPATALPHIDALAAVAADMPSARFAAEARWRRLVTEPRFDGAAFEQLAGAPDAPVAARRAQALLGATAALDAVDRAVLGAVGRRFAVPQGPPGPWTPGWGVDVAHQRAWLPDGSWVEFSGRPQLWKLLSALLPGEADKETLVQSVWGEDVYHPLRHDNRLHVTVRNLRVALGDGDPPFRVLTTETGYRLSGGLRALRPENPPR